MKTVRIVCPEAAAWQARLSQKAIQPKAAHHIIHTYMLLRRLAGAARPAPCYAAASRGFGGFAAARGGALLPAAAAAAAATAEGHCSAAEGSAAAAAAAAAAQHSAWADAARCGSCALLAALPPPAVASGDPAGPRAR